MAYLRIAVVAFQDRICFFGNGSVSIIHPGHILGAPAEEKPVVKRTVDIVIKSEHRFGIRAIVGDCELVDNNGARPRAGLIMSLAVAVL